MCKFVNLIVDRNNLLSQNTQYLSNVIFLYLRYEKFLNDDYAAKVTYENILNLIENCGDLFFVFLNEEVLCPINFFTGEKRVTKETLSIHHFDASWCSDVTRRTLRLKRLIGIRCYCFLYAKFLHRSDRWEW